jgi:hypothetical protein
MQLKDVAAASAVLAEGNLISKEVAGRFEIRKRRSTGIWGAH